MKDIAGYLYRMEKSMQDKLFFVNKIDLFSFDNIVDFGCANGALLNILKKIVKNKVKLVGYDCSQYMLTRAKKHSHSSIYFTNSYQEISNLTGKNLIIFSSVLHEYELGGIKI